MIYRADEFDMTAAMAAVQAQELSIKKEALIKELGELQKAITEKVMQKVPEYMVRTDLSEYMEESVQEKESDTARGAVYILEFLEKYLGKNEQDYCAAAEAAMLVLFLKYREDNQTFLHLETPKKMQMRALTMLLPDMLGASEMEQWIIEILPECVSKDHCKKLADYLTDASHEAVISNLFQTIGSMNAESEEGRNEILRAAIILKREMEKKKIFSLIPGQIGESLCVLSEQIGDSAEVEQNVLKEKMQPAEEILKEDAGNMPAEKEADITSLMDRQRQLMRQIEETDTVLVRLVEML